MHIAHIDIQNFRKLKSCRVELSGKKTVFVGANNSGKTSAMDALMSFLKNRNVSITDFTLSNWSAINKIGTDWISNTESALDLTRLSWETLVPTIDVWLQVEDDKIHYVYHIIPRLDWSGGLLGVRLTFEPKNVEDLYKGYKDAFDAAKNTIESRKTVPEEGKKCSLSLWPQSLREFLNKESELHKYFVIRAYILDPSKCNDSEPQSLPPASEPLEGDPFDGLFKIHIINAQRGFSDPNTSEGSADNNRLSSQLREYYDKHLDPVKLPNSSDLDALETIEDARTVFDDKLKKSFNSAISELESLNYPGFSDPQILLSSKIAA